MRRSPQRRKICTVSDEQLLPSGAKYYPTPIHLTKDNEYAEAWCGIHNTWPNIRQEHESIDETTCLDCLRAVKTFGWKALIRLTKLISENHG